MSKNNGMRGTFEEDLTRCMSRGRGRTRNIFIADVGAPRCRVAAPDFRSSPVPAIFVLGVV